jgi:iron complex outermembrane receptor protein
MNAGRAFTKNSYGGETMNRIPLRVALFTSVSLQFLVGGQALAQSSDEAVAERTIIVTARRIEERLQDVPISIAVVNQEQLSKANIVGVDDLVKIVPGLNVESRYSSETNAFSIRGFNQALRTTSTVGTYFADVVAPRGGAGAFPGGDGAGPGSLFDLQNVQVLKGPQGTLFGRNTTGGAVLLMPRKPTSRFEGYVEGSIGNYDMRRLQAVVNLPVADWARLRLGVDRMLRDGTLNNISGIGPRKLNDVNYTALRGSLVLDITPNLENYTIVSYLNSDHIGTQPQLYRANPASSFGALAVPQVNRLNAPGADPYQVEQTLSNPRSLTKQFQAINITTWSASDTLTFKNIMSYASFKQSLNQSVFGSNFQRTIPQAGGGSVQAYFSTAQAFNGEGAYGNDQRSFTEEFQIQGRSGDGRLTYQGGLYYEHSTPGDPSNNESISTGALCQVGAYTGLSSMRCANGSVNQSIYSIEYINMAAYAQATYAATEQLKLTAGARITYDRTRGTSQSFLATFPQVAPVIFPQFVPAVIAPGVAGCQVPNRPFPNCKVGSDVLHTSSTRPTWTLSAQYNPTQDMMFYGTYSRGYRQGSAAPAAIGAKTSFDPETVDSFELGGKASWKGSVSGHLNISGFYSKLKDAQLLVGLNCVRLPPPQGPGCPAGGSATSVFNAGKAHMYGAEFDGSLRPSDFFRVDFAGAWVRSRVDAFVADITPYLANFDNRLNTATVGDPLPLTPEFAGNISGTVTLPVPENVGTIEFSAMYRYATSFSTAASDTNNTLNANRALAGLPAIPVDRASPIRQVDLNLDWQNIAGQPVDLSFFVTNLTKQVTYTLIQPLFGSFGFDVRYVGQPRMYGMRLKVRFGEGN